MFCHKANITSHHASVAVSLFSFLFYKNPDDELRQTNLSKSTTNNLNEEIRDKFASLICYLKKQRVTHYESNQDDFIFESFLRVFNESL